MLGLVPFQNFLMNIPTTNNIFIQCMNNLKIITKVENIMFYQALFCFQAQS
jgi:hypothetical protein